MTPKTEENLQFILEFTVLFAYTVYVVNNILRDIPEEVSMGNLFSYENPVMQLLMKLGDMIILNFIFLICCLPIVTIGAAQAGLYTAMKVMQDPEDESSLVEAYLRGFKNGFLTITLSWGLMVVALVIVAIACAYAAGYGLPTWICIVPIAILAWYIAQIPAFHSRFGCTAMQLIRNVWFLIIAHPLRTLGVAVLTWLPLGLFLSQYSFAFFSLVPVWCTLYFSTAAAFSYGFLKKPFNVLIAHFNATQEEAASKAEAALPETETELEEV